MYWVLVLLCIFLRDAIAAPQQKKLLLPAAIHGSRSNNPFQVSTLAKIYGRGANRNMLSKPTLAASANHVAEEAAALLSFKASLTGDPTGALESWKNGSNHCAWQGISCSIDGFVSSINLTQSAISGTLSPSLSQLHHLKSLDLSDNFLTGPLPASLCSPSKNALTILNLKNNSFSGFIPRTLGNCTSLTSIALYYNTLSGPIPSELSSLSRLQTLTLSFNMLNGSLPIPVLMNCTKLTILALSQNAFTGPLPREIGNLRRMQNLWLDSNGFSGRIPSELGNLTRLSLLQLDTNNLTGSIPPSLGQLHSLTKLLSLSINQLSGPIPPQLGKLSNLVIMTLKGNSLNGTVPKELGKMQSIQGLYLEDNLLEGTIPVELANCTSLQELRLDNNRLTGAIPDAFGSLQRLSILYVHDNMLQGHIPTSLASLTSLLDLSLGSNALNGSIPPSLASLSSITFNFSLPLNSLSGTIPLGLGLMIHVQNIDLSANNISGSIPPDIEDCVNLMHLNLSFNSLTGEIPDIFQGIDFLETLDFSSNLLSGGIPSSLANLTHLQYINLSYNNLSGPIPLSGVFAKMNASSFLGNPGLCGPPLTHLCPENANVLVASSEKGGMKVGIKILIAVASLLYAILLLLAFFVCLRRKRVASLPRNMEDDESVSVYSKHLRRFTARELKLATEDFCEERIIGTGSMSKVYSATNVMIKIAPPTQQINAAVKVLCVDRNPSFCIELEALGSIRHRNLVKFYGFCDSGRLQAFVLELLPNGSLQDRLHGSATHLSIFARLHIALDVANGLAYLHHGLNKPIVHRDVKPGNILFDQDMVAKVADFGIAKLLDHDEVHSKAQGTLGYVAPEYGESTRVDTKGDVYSFGVVMLELLTRKEPTNAMFGIMGISLPMWARSAYPERVSEILDPQLLEDLGLHYVHEEDAAMKGMVELALSCTCMRADERPDMEAVVTRLTSFDSLLLRAATQHEDICSPSSMPKLEEPY